MLCIKISLIAVLLPNCLGIWHLDQVPVSKLLILQRTDENIYIIDYLIGVVVDQVTRFVGQKQEDGSYYCPSYQIWVLNKIIKGGSAKISLFLHMRF